MLVFCVNESDSNTPSFIHTEDKHAHLRFFFFFFYLDFTTRQDYFTHFEPSQS